MFELLKKATKHIREVLNDFYSTKPKCDYHGFTIDDCHYCRREKKYLKSGVWYYEWFIFHKDFLKYTEGYNSRNYFRTLKK